MLSYELNLTFENIYKVDFLEVLMKKGGRLFLLWLVFASLIFGVFVFSFEFIDACTSAGSPGTDHEHQICGSDCIDCGERHGGGGTQTAITGCIQEGSYDTITRTIQTDWRSCSVGGDGKGSCHVDWATTYETNYYCPRTSCSIACANPAGCANTCRQCPFSNRSLCDGLISFWPFDVSSGSNRTFAKDVWGGNNLEAINNPSFVSGVKGESYNFSGNNYLIRNASSDLLLNNYTYSAWIKLNDVPPINYAFGVLGIGSLYNDVGQDQAILIENSYVMDNHNSGAVGISYGDMYSPFVSGLFVNPSNLLSSWHLLILTRNTLDMKLKFYLDGTLIDSESLRTFNATYSNQIGKTPVIGIGVRDDHLLNTNYNIAFKGMLDEVAIWNRALTPTEIQNYYDSFNTTLQDAFWSNLRGNRISSSDAGDSVLMQVNGIGLQNKLINYTIKKVGVIDWNPFNWFTHTILHTESLGISDWQTELGTFFFNVKVENLANQSNELEVGSANDSAPVAIIASPPNHYNASVNQTISFTHASYDEDDMLRVKWDFGDGTSFVVENYSLALTPGLGNTLHNYSSAGTYTVKLNVSEMARNQSSVDSVNVKVIGSGISVFPVISSPASGLSSSNVIRFNASASYILNCSASSVPAADFAFATNNNEFNCSYILRPNNRTTKGFDVIANWNIGSLVVSGNWSNMSAVDFTKYFIQSGTYNVKLNLTYKPSLGRNISETVYSSFSVGSGWRCDAYETSAFWNKTDQIFNAVNNCTLYASESFRSCCPTIVNNVCNTTSKKCEGTASFCDDLTAFGRNTCEAASDRIILNSVSSDVVCGETIYYTNASGASCTNVTRCSCSWQSNDDECGVKISTDSDCEGGIIIPGGDSCFYNTVREDRCNDTGVIILHWNPVTPRASCRASSREIPCVSNTRLPVFDKFNFIFAVLGLVIIYAVFSRKFK